MTNSLFPQLNFFFVGAPKCGTTSIAYVLSQHPNIFLSNPKEPHFFEKDIDRGIKSLETYRALFSKSKKHHTVIGEASTGYLFSEIAIPTIIENYPEAKYLVVIRNPYEMAISLHNQAIRSNYEDEVDFNIAWKLQEKRKHNRELPKSCPSNRLLLYKERCSLGDQIERLYRLAAAKNICVTFLDDLKLDPDGFFKIIYRFLQIPENHVAKYPKLNKRTHLRWPFVNMAIISIGNFKRSIGIVRSLGIANKINQVAFTKGIQHPEITADVRKEMDQAFCQQIKIIEDLTGRDLSHWYYFRTKTNA
ncbi:sulfotransferase domain-containing protein [uncultured Desulfosarcina sp.]|uniref:sulfotransferase domain-containing protein n=1 Tax=uncultured Desulfosarcina sp. TaxID=218289 RepID=UPI0029C67016|nr:sulfotransferase domain-containing protein [uncultured Desulfosarcina sp.]